MTYAIWSWVLVSIRRHNMPTLSPFTCHYWQAGVTPTHSRTPPMTQRESDGSLGRGPLPRQTMTSPRSFSALSADTLYIRIVSFELSVEGREYLSLLLFHPLITIYQCRVSSFFVVFLSERGRFIMVSVLPQWCTRIQYMSQVMQWRTASQRTDANLYCKIVLYSFIVEKKRETRKQVHLDGRFEVQSILSFPRHLKEICTR